MGLLREALSEDQEPTPTTSKGLGRKGFWKEKSSSASLCSFQCLELINAVKNQLKMSIMKELLSHRTRCPFLSVITQEFPSCKQKKKTLPVLIQLLHLPEKEVSFCVSGFSTSVTHSRKVVPDPAWHWEPAALKAILILLLSVAFWSQNCPFKHLYLYFSLALFSPRQRFKDPFPSSTSTSEISKILH